MPQYFELPCPVIARRAKSDLSRCSFSEYGGWCRDTNLNLRFICFGKATSNLSAQPRRSTAGIILMIIKTNWGDSRYPVGLL